jgi:hypothetical protein
MKKIILLFFFIIIFGCKKEPIYNNYDEITHYSITDEDTFKVDTIKRFRDIFGIGDYHKIDFNKFEEELVSFGYKKNELKENKIKQVDSIISNKIYYGSIDLTACTPLYRDVLILKKNNKIVSILKICFECKMIANYGDEIKNNFNEKDIESDDYFNNFINLQKTLINKN